MSSPYDAVYDFFAQGNAWTFAQLQKLFKEGPIDWQQKRDEALDSVKEPGPQGKAGTG